MSSIAKSKYCRNFLKPTEVNYDFLHHVLQTILSVSLETLNNFIRLGLSTHLKIEISFYKMKRNNQALLARGFW